MRVNPPNPLNPKKSVPNHLTRTARLYYHKKCTHTWSQIDGSGQLIKPTLGERNKDQYVDGNRGQNQSHRIHR